MQKNSRGWCETGIMKEHYRQARAYPRRQAVRYTIWEDLDLADQYTLGFSIQEIAEWHERSVNGVGTQLERLGVLRRNS